MYKINVKSILILLAFFIVIGVIVFYFSFKEAEEKRSNTELEVLDDVSMFFSVSSNINNFLTYVTDGNLTATMNILDKNYIDNNYNTIVNYVTNEKSQYKNSSFSPVLMYQVGYKQNFKYLVKGYLKNDVYEEPSTIKSEIYLVLNLDIEKNIFSIEIIDKNKFEESITTEKFEYSNISSNNNNKFSYTSMNEEKLAVLYYNDFYDNVFSNTKFAYDKVTIDTKNKYFPTYEEFVDKMITNNNFENISVKGYNVSDGVYTIMDKRGDKFIFTAKGIMDYSVTIEFNE